MNTIHAILSSPEQAAYLDRDRPISLTLIGDGVQVPGLLSFRNNIQEVNFLDNTIIADRILEECNNLRKVMFSDNLVSIGAGAFSACHSLEQVVLPTMVSKIGVSAFERCLSLSKMHFKSTVAEIGEKAFYQCTGLMEVAFARDTRITTIPAETFSGCTGMSSLDLGGIQVIGERAFESSGITKLHVPETVTRIDDMAFYNCPYLKTIDISSPDLTFGAHVFFGSEITELMCTPSVLQQNNFSHIEHIVCRTVATTLSGDEHPFDLMLPQDSVNFNPEQQLIEQSDGDLGEFFDLIVDGLPLRVSLDKARTGELNLDTIAIFFNDSTDIHIKSKVEQLHSVHKSAGGTGDSIMTVSDIPGLEHENVDTLVDHGFHTLISLIGTYLIHDYDYKKLIEFVGSKSSVDVAMKVADAISVIVRVCKVYVRGDIQNSELLEFMSATEARRQLSSLVPFDKLRHLGGLNNLPIELTAAEILKFQEKKISEIFHLIGHYFAFSRDPDLMEAFLEDFVSKDKVFPLVNYLHRDLMYEHL